MATASRRPECASPDARRLPGTDDGSGNAAALRFRFRSLTEPDARQIARWRYPAPYTFYDLPEDAWPDLLGLGQDFQAVDIAPGSASTGSPATVGRTDRWLPEIVTRVLNRTRPAGQDRFALRPGVAGFVCFGSEAQVSGARDAGLYADDALDIGLGLRPNLTGRGLGAGFFAACLDHAIETRHPATLRLAVATFNTRAITVYERAGFRPIARCQSPVRGRPAEFMIMVRD